MLRRLNDALPALVGGIVVYGVLLTLIGICLAPRRLYWAIGAVYGTAIAVGMAVNMAVVIFDAVSGPPPKGRTNWRVVGRSVLRYVIVVVLFGVLGLFSFGSLIAAFLGLMGLKVSAYVQPAVMNWQIKTGRRPPDPPLLSPEEWDEEEDDEEKEKEDYALSRLLGDEADLGQKEPKGAAEEASDGSDSAEKEFPKEPEDAAEKGFGPDMTAEAKADAKKKASGRRNRRMRRPRRKDSIRQIRVKKV